jgi:hypothetical protein
MDSAAPRTDTTNCPRCGKPLIDPTGLGWCKACGYCHSLGEEKTEKAEKPASAPARPPLEPPRPPSAGPPIYLFIILANVILLMAGAYAINRYVRLEPLQRALWTTLQIVAGVLLMFIGQFLGVLRLAPANPTLSFKDCFVPFHLYELVVKNLPSTRWTLYLGAWGLALIASALMFIGGLGHWFKYLPSSEKKWGQGPAPRVLREV